MHGASRSWHWPPGEAGLKGKRKCETPAIPVPLPLTPPQCVTERVGTSATDEDLQQHPDRLLASISGDAHPEPLPLSLFPFPIFFFARVCHSFLSCVLFPPQLPFSLFVDFVIAFFFFFVGHREKING